MISTPYEDYGTALSLECIGSYEISLTAHHTINFWGGFGAVSMIRDLKYPAFGMETAIEVRHYFQHNGFRNFNAGLYAGFAYMRIPYFHGRFSGRANSVGFVPGLKITWKKNISSWLVGEPYIGVSAAWYERNVKELFTWRIPMGDPGLFLTFGIRIGYNKVQFRHKELTFPESMRKP